MRHEGRSGLHDFIKEKKTPKPKQERKETTMEEIETSLREVGTAQDCSFERLKKLADTKGGEPVFHLLNVRDYWAEREDLEKREQSGALSDDEKKRLTYLAGKLQGMDGTEITRMFDRAHHALATMVPDKRLEDPADVFPWLEIPKGQKQSPYDVHLKRVTGTFDFKTKGLLKEEKEEIQVVAARMKIVHQNDAFLRKLAGSDEKNEIIKIHAERIAAEKEANARSADEQVLDQAAE